MNIQLNDWGDILIRLRPSKRLLAKLSKNYEIEEIFAMTESVDGNERDPLMNCSFFYYTAGEKNSKNGTYLYFDSPKDDIDNLRGFSMNESFIFFWNGGHIWKINLESKERTKINLIISEKEVMTKVKRVRTGSNENIVCIRVT